MNTENEKVVDLPSLLMIAVLFVFGLLVCWPDENFHRGDKVKIKGTDRIGIVVESSFLDKMVRYDTSAGLVTESFGSDQIELIE